MAHDTRYFAYFKSYHVDERDFVVEITKDEFELLKKDEWDLARGNWSPEVTMLGLLDREYIYEGHIKNWENVIEIAVC